MQNNKFYILICCFILSFTIGKAQILSLNEVLMQIESNNPQLKMYDAEIQSLKAVAVGAKSWMPPEVATGFFMTPYNPMMWKADGTSPGMGSYMIGVTQMIPNSSKLKADYSLLNEMSLVEKENKNYALNQLNAMAKNNYYQGLVLVRKIKIAAEDLLLLDYMIKSIEIRYQFNLDKLSTYYKAKSQYSSLESEIMKLENNLAQTKIAINTLMARDKNTLFEIADTYELKEFSTAITDTFLSQNRSDVKAIEKTIGINQLKIEVEKKKILPEFGIKYDHMFSFGAAQQFSLMGMATIPMPWSTKMNKATMESFKIKNESLNWQKQMILNEASGKISGLNAELKSLKNQYEIAQKSIIPALKRNYDTAILAWQNNTGDLFAALDAWEALNMAQLDALDKLQSTLATQVEIEKQLESK